MVESMKYFHKNSQQTGPTSSYAVVTACIGEKFEQLAELTMPTLKAYANSIDADFVVIDEKKISVKYTMYEKYQIYDVLGEYDRIIYVDLDIIIRNDCPNLFDIVPDSKLGLFDEGRFMQCADIIYEAMKIHNINCPEWHEQSYNAGLIVASKQHRNLFVKPKIEVKMYGPYPHYDQPHLTLKILTEGYEVFELDCRFNRMQVVDSHIKDSPLNAYIVHFAGLSNNLHFFDIVKSAIDIWKRNGMIYAS